MTTNVNIISLESLGVFLFLVLCTLQFYLPSVIFFNAQFSSVKISLKLLCILNVIFVYYVLCSQAEGYLLKQFYQKSLSGDGLAQIACFGLSKLSSTVS